MAKIKKVSSPIHRLIDEMKMYLKGVKAGAFDVTISGVTLDELASAPKSKAFVLLAELKSVNIPCSKEMTMSKSWRTNI